MASDPRVHKPRVPKSYTDAQLTFLKSHLTEFERRSHGNVRGDAKKFALERATEFITRFGLPEEFVRSDDDEGKFREQIYNWFKNTAGRTRRKAEGKTRAKKASSSTPTLTPIIQKSQQDLEQPTNLTWNPVCTPPLEDPYSAHAQNQAQSEQPHANGLDISSVTVTSSQVAQQAQSQVVPHVNIQYTSSLQQAAPQIPQQSSLTPQPQVAQSHLSHIKLTTETLRTAFLQGVDASTLSSMIHSFVITEQSTSAVPLIPVIEALFEAVSSDATSNRNPHAYLRQFLDASAYFTPNIIHAGVSGPLAGPRAIQMQVRKHAMWVPSPKGPSSSSSMSITDEMHRIAQDRQRRKDHIQWANIHAAALELGMLGLGPYTGNVDSNSINSGYAYAMGRALSETMARDAVWESDEVEWVAGIIVLRAVIRTAVRGDRRQRDEYEELLRTYEGRWKEIKDEARQALVTEVLLAARDDLGRLDDC